MKQGDGAIKKALSEGTLIIENGDESRIGPASIDFVLDNKFLRVDCNDIVDLRNKESFINTPIESDEVILNPGDFLLGVSQELIQLPKNLGAQVKGKSSLARVGLEVGTIAGWLDPGYRGTVTLALVNHSANRVRLYKGMPVCQVVIEEVKEVEVDYGERKGSKYQNSTTVTASKVLELSRVEPGVVTPVLNLELDKVVGFDVQGVKTHETIELTGHVGVLESKVDPAYKEVVRGELTSKDIDDAIKTPAPKNTSKKNAKKEESANPLQPKVEVQGKDVLQNKTTSDESGADAVESKEDTKQ